MQKSQSLSLILKVTLLSASTLTVMSGATIAPSLPAMQAYFAEVEHGAYWVRLVLTLPALFIVVGAPIAGVLVDRVGRKPLLVGATVVYGVAGCSGFFLDTLSEILVGRGLLGLAVAGVMTSVTTLIADYFQGQSRATFMGLQAAFMALGGVIFLSLGGFLADLSWRFPFLIYGAALLLLPLMLGALFEPPPIDRYPLNFQPSEASLPLKPLSLIYGIAFLQMLLFYLIPVQLPFYLLRLTAATAKESGIAIAFATLLSAIASMLYGRIKRRFNFKQVVAIAFVVVGLGYGVISLATSYGQVMLGLAISGLGFGTLMPNLNVWLIQEVPSFLRGRALGGLTTALFLGQFLSPLATQPLSEQVGLGATYGIAGGVLLVLGLGFWGLTSKH